MNLIALLVGLAIERLATHLLHWRRMRWLDRIIDAGFGQALRMQNWPAFIPVVLLALLLVMPVFAIIFSLDETTTRFTYLLLAVFVLLFSIGPQDIGEEVADYCKALESEDETLIQNAAKAIIEDDVPDDARERIAEVEAAVCVQANNRLFAVVFWFLVLGPLGAWSYRVTDLIRRRAVFNAARELEPDTEADTVTDSGMARIRDAAELLHGWLAWIPARMTALGYAAAGHFDEAIAAFRALEKDRDGTNSERSEQLLARVGIAALAIQDKSDESITARGIRGATAANRLVFRQLLIWAVIISAMTLYGLKP